MPCYSLEVSEQFPLITDLPLAYRERSGAQGAPTIVLLHGLGSNELDLLGLQPLLDERFHLVSVRAPREMGGNAFGWFDIEWTPEPVPNLEQAQESITTLRRFLGELGDRHQLTPERLLLMGFSQGAMLSYILALREPERYGGVIAMSGRIPPQLAQDSLPDHNGLPVLVTHGTHDEVIPVSYARRSRALLERLNVDLEYREYPMGHHLTQECLDDITDWLGGRLG